MNPLVKTAIDEMMKELKFVYEVKEQVEGVKLELQLMQSFLEDVDYHISNAESEQQRVNRLFRQRVYQTEEASLDGEDIVATYLAKVALRKRDGIVNLIKRYACIPRHCKDIHVVGSMIEKLESKLSTLRQEIGGVGPSSSSNGYTKSLPRRSYGHIHDRNIVGLDERVNEVIDLLQEQEIVSIYGMGGLGKTTLAKKIFHDKRVREHFDKFIWVYVSQQFKERDVWESTLIELTSPSSNERKEISEVKDDELLARLCQAQNDQKCIVVLDDVWNIVDWEKLHVGFQLQERSQSKILFTTRKKEVAEHANRKGSYGGLKPLSDEKSLKLLRKIALEGRDGDEIAGNY